MRLVRLIRIPGALPDAEPEYTRVRMSFGGFAVQAERLWMMVREPVYPPMGGEPYWHIDWGAYREAFDANDPLVRGYERAEFFRAMLICRNIENSDPKGWPEMWVNAREPLTVETMTDGE